MAATAYSRMTRGVLQTEGTDNPIDLRSDTVTHPSPAMYDAMMSAPVGDDVYGSDETVNALELKVAQLLDKEAALFVSSGTQSNLIAMLTHCQRGEAVITGNDYHVCSSEAYGASVLGGIAIQPMPTDADGGLSTLQINGAIKPDDAHFAITRLLCLENTVSGSVQSPQAIDALCEVARNSDLSLHLDGARLMNASVALSMPAAELAAPFDTVSLCLSKGLGAPVGSVLSGPADFIQRARRYRKMLGGGMRQAGILAAAGLFALDNNVTRLLEDHANAQALAQGLSKISALSIKQTTNMVFVAIPTDNADELQASLAQQGIIISADYPSFRLVTHLDVNDQDIERIIEAFNQFFQTT